MNVPNRRTGESMTSALKAAFWRKFWVVMLFSQDAMRDIMHCAWQEPGVGENRQQISKESERNLLRYLVNYTLSLGFMKPKLWYVVHSKCRDIAEESAGGFWAPAADWKRYLRRCLQGKFVMFVHFCIQCTVSETVWSHDIDNVLHSIQVQSMFSCNVSSFKTIN